MPDSQQRRLAAILAADIAGYSALMSSDEEATVRDLKGHQSIVLPLIGTHGGRVIDTAGDGILAEFASVLNAVRCAVAIQKVMAERNADIEPARRMQFRIGVNLGDVIFDDTRIYGDGINIAARLESIAEAGGVCISDKVYQEIRGKLDVAAQDLGFQSLKNIVDQVRVHRIEIEGTGSATISPQRSVQMSTFAIPEKPSIAVLPFTNMSVDPSQEYFSDGITEDIITELSRFSELFVIARNSSFQYKGRFPDIRHVGRELGVRYVLEGSIRRSNDRVRITAQLIDASSGTHLWAERYDRNLEDVFAIQDDVVRSIVPILAAHVGNAETQRSLLRSPADMRAYDYYLHASATFAAFYRRNSMEKILETRRLIAECLQVDPRFARAHVLLSTTKIVAYSLRLDSHDFFNPSVLNGAYEDARAGVDLMPELPEAHAQLGYTYTWMHQHDLAISEFERAFALNPNFTDRRFCATLLYAGKAEKAIEAARRHMRFDPFALPIAQGFLGFALLSARRYEEAIRELQEYVARSSGHHGGRYWLISSYCHAGRIEDGRKEAEALLRVRPDFSIASSAAGQFPFRCRDDLQHFLDGLRLAGLPE